MINVVENLPYLGYQDNAEVVGFLKPFDGYVNEVDITLNAGLPINSNLNYYGQLAGYKLLLSDALTDEIKVGFITSGVIRAVGTNKAITDASLILGVIVLGYFMTGGQVFVVLNNQSLAPWSLYYDFYQNVLLPFFTPAWVSLKICYPNFYADYSKAGDPIGPLDTLLLLP